MACSHEFRECRIKDYLHCDLCGSYKSAVAPPASEVYRPGYWTTEAGHSSLYEQAYNVDLHTENGVSKSRFILDRIETEREAALEIGCAPGRMLYWLKWAARFEQVDGIEVNKAAERDIRIIASSDWEEWAKYKINAHPILLFDVFPHCTSAIERGRWPSGYTYILASDVFEHSHEPEAFLAECFRLLKPGGQLFLMLPLADELPDDSRFFCGREHVYLHSEQNMLAMLADTGFDTATVDQWALGHDTMSVRKP